MEGDGWVRGKNAFAGGGESADGYSSPVSSGAKQPPSLGVTAPRSRPSGDTSRSAPEAGRSWTSCSAFSGSWGHVPSGEEGHSAFRQCGGGAPGSTCRVWAASRAARRLSNAIARSLNALAAAQTVSRAVASNVPTTSAGKGEGAVLRLLDTHVSAAAAACGGDDERGGDDEGGNGSVMRATPGSGVLKSIK